MDDNVLLVSLVLVGCLLKWTEAQPAEKGMLFHVLFMTVKSCFVSAVVNAYAHYVMRNALILGCMHI